MRTSRAVACFECLLNRPVVIDGAARVDDASQSVLKSLPVMSLFADHDVGQQAELRAAPIGSPPGMRLVEAAVGASGIALRHVAHHVGPNLFGEQEAALDARNRLNVDGETLLDPVVLVIDR